MLLEVYGLAPLLFLIPKDGGLMKDPREILKME